MTQEEVLKIIDSAGGRIEFVELQAQVPAKEQTRLFWLLQDMKLAGVTRAVVSVNNGVVSNVIERV